MAWDRDRAPPAWTDIAKARLHKRPLAPRLRAGLTQKHRRRPFRPMSARGACGRSIEAPSSAPPGGHAGLPPRGGAGTGSYDTFDDAPRPTETRCFSAYGVSCRARADALRRARTAIRPRPRCGGHWVPRSPPPGRKRRLGAFQTLGTLAQVADVMSTVRLIDRRRGDPHGNQPCAGSRPAQQGYAAACTPASSTPITFRRRLSALKANVFVSSIE